MKRFDIALRKNMTVKYLLAFILIIVVPIFLIGMLMNTIYINILLQKTSERYFQSLEETVKVIEEEVKRMSLLTSTIANNDELNQLLNSYNNTSNVNTKFTYSKKIDSFLNVIFNYSTQIDSVIFFFKNEGYYYYKNYPVLDEKIIRASAWYQNSLHNGGRIKVQNFMRNFTYNPNDVFLISLSLGHPGVRADTDVELVYASFRLNFFDDVWYGKISDDMQELEVIDNGGTILLSHNKSHIGKNISSLGLTLEFLKNESDQLIIKADHTTMLLSSYSIYKTDWKILNLVNYKSITKEIDKFYGMEMIFFAFVIILFLLFSLIFFKNIINPIKNLMNKMKQVEKGNFNIEVEKAGFDEIHSLNEAFNKMVIEIDKLTGEIQVKEAGKLEAEIEALQFQINPHFISNTLNSIRLMAMLSKTDNIRLMTEALMKLLLEVFSGKGRLTKIRSELKNLENYIYIMKVRFGDKFDIIYRIEDDLYEYYILKIILQPIIENAILHGLSEKKEKGLIELKAYKSNEDLIFEVIDNGKGIDEDKIEKILSLSSADTNRYAKSIGFINVDKRIKLFHGMKYGLSIDSIVGEYTKVTFLLPIIKEVAEDV